MPALLDAATFVLSLSVFSCLLALTLGYLLAYGSGDAGAGVARHMWGAIALTIAFCFVSWSVEHPAVCADCIPTCWVACWFCSHGQLTRGPHSRTAINILPSTFLYSAQTFGRHRNGTSQGLRFSRLVLRPSHLSHPRCQLRALPRTAESQRRSPHGYLRPADARRKRRRRHHSRKTGAEYLARAHTLPPDHKKFMPGEGKPPLKPEEIAWIRAWILQGASPELKTLAGINIPAPFHEEPLPQVPDYSGIDGSDRADSEGCRD